MTRGRVTVLLKELPAAYARLSDGMVVVGSNEHIAILRVIDTVTMMAKRGMLTKKERIALSGILSGMTAPQSRAALGGKTNASVHKLRERSVEKIREELDGQERKGT